ncbi:MULTISPECIES: DUF1667 domain-containing protein [Terrisporobacter]|uniref:Molybdopterin oxidoreductase n=2 Tax=Terrisporobacter TaxID=1505652 RepID=A0A0B3W5A5_9FIRM|nr:MULTISPECIES: DUF1667 domain-containing protein [Terrisporobacter]KHS57592.1 molybdopterin oxidoreductase [Terrisporobacter othiniensis]MCR1821514.1 DUF1667 domain-containing protein [Terrisporobacter muris]
MKREITCIVCPKGCQMIVSNIDGQYIVEGNSCIRGAKYGVDEVTSPKRMITSTVRLEGAYLNMLPVKTSVSVPKDLVFEIMNILSTIKITAPVKVGDIIVKNILDTGVDIVSTKTISNVCQEYENDELRKIL